MPNEFQFTGTVFRWDGNAAWHFVALPSATADEIDASATPGGFGSVRVRARVGESVWQTSIFPDKGRGTYLLPLKKQVREANDLHDGSAADFHIVIDPDS